METFSDKEGEKKPYSRGARHDGEENKQLLPEKK